LSYNEATSAAAQGSAFDCNTTARDATQTPPFDRLELLAFLPGGLSPRYAGQVICQRGINFTPDSAFLSTLRYYGVAPDFVDSLAKITPRASAQPAADRVSAYGLLDVAMTDKHHGHCAAHLIHRRLFHAIRFATFLFWFELEEFTNHFNLRASWLTSIYTQVL
jgi:hypothetical protein